MSLDFGRRAGQWPVGNGGAHRNVGPCRGRHGRVGWLVGARPCGEARVQGVGPQGHGAAAGGATLHEAADA
ncbi:hypothetical protein GUJ93_ZPchr0007g3209 [Zizania palustris]|uniref:Uncharacterized protein n=1 Tax=Zizania palustris TaxID=103762 RepID=A0A8J5W6N1_ZIZPA|nr:hypothetical protein GUJ93_ZPchr0007g3209 [Zizania palustris]